MEFKSFDHKMTGIIVPVASIRTNEACGIGEFSDLVALGEWCQNVGLEVIQILPVNDTGRDNAPYSALSAFALHPIYIRLNDVEGSAHFSDIIGEEATKLNAEERLSYYDVYDFKMEILRKIYLCRRKGLRADSNYANWVNDNPWAIKYSAFRVCKDNEGGLSWQDWKTMRRPAGQLIKQFYDAHPEDAGFYTWVQYELEKQLTDVTAQLGKMGIMLKGDIPILMSTDSADVWAFPEYFDMSKRAGAPPDMFSPDGQNWGFPTYNWDALEKDNFSWWKDRLKQADKFYHAFRIDHVLGFFRIWQIPATEESGLTGHFHPSTPISAEMLRTAGFDDGRIKWMATPHYTFEMIQEAVGDEAEMVSWKYLRRVGNENLFNLLPAVESEVRITKLDASDKVKSFLKKMHQDRMFLEITPGAFNPTWTFYNTRAWHSLMPHEQDKINQIFSARNQSDEVLWADNGRDLLKMMKDTTKMLCCAEDLGAVPDCVPSVLEELDILGLRVERWTRDNKTAGEPYILPQDYPTLTVCTPGVHDTSTLRGWWQEDFDKAEYYSRINPESANDFPKQMTPALAQAIVKNNLDSRSMLTVFQLQDLFAMTGYLRHPNPDFERVNIPGTVGDHNWTWRMALTIDELQEQDVLNTQLKEMIDIRLLEAVPA